MPASLPVTYIHREGCGWVRAASATTAAFVAYVYHRDGGWVRADGTTIGTTMSEKRDERMTPIVEALGKAGLNPREHDARIEPIIDRGHLLSDLPDPVKRVIWRETGKALGLDDA